MNSKEFKRLIILDVLYEIQKYDVQYEEDVVEAITHAIENRMPGSMEEIFSLSSSYGYEIELNEDFARNFEICLYEELEEKIFNLGVF